MTSVKTLNPKAEVMGRGAALFMNINAAKGLHDVMKTNLGPKGTIKMLVGGAGGPNSDHKVCCYGKGYLSFVINIPYCPDHVVVACRHQADKGRQCLTQGDADPESNCSHDCQDCCGTGRHNRVRSCILTSVIPPEWPTAHRFASVVPELLLTKNVLTAFIGMVQLQLCCSLENS